MTEYKSLTLKLTPEEHRELKRLSADTGRTMKDLIMESFRRLLKEYEDQQKGK